MQEFVLALSQLATTTLLLGVMIPSPRAMGVGALSAFLTYVCTEGISVTPVDWAPDGTLSQASVTTLVSGMLMGTISAGIIGLAYAKGEPIGVNKVFLGAGIAMELIFDLAAIPMITLSLNSIKANFLNPTTNPDQEAISAA
jgi:hypothetical protein